MMKNLEMLLIVTLIAIAVISDLYSYKVKNQITFGFMTIALIYNLAAIGSEGLCYTLLGIVIPILILFPLYMSKMLGAGDIKLFSALGAFVGYKVIAICIAYSFIVGAFTAIIIMIIRKNAIQRFQYFFNYIKCCLLCMAVVPYGDFNMKQDGSKMHFTIPIAIGTILALAL